ncbi:hypothetical protein, partial [Sinorhizobium meliloti]|uniref:hypothetical protein n=1 Tax=Rhizobium meliloti TaxID=382 RepID=UPI000FD94E71
MLRKTIKGKLAQVRSPPWQLLMTSVSDDAPALSAGTNSVLSLIFELFPHLGSLTVQTTGGYIRVTRDFTSGNAAEVDRMLAGIFGNDQAVTGIAFPATSTRLCASSSAKLGGHACWSCGLTECEFLVLSQVVH